MLVASAWGLNDDVTITLLFPRLGARTRRLCYNTSRNMRQMVNSARRRDRLPLGGEVLWQRGSQEEWCDASGSAVPTRRVGSIEDVDGPDTATPAIFCGCDGE